MFHQINAEKVSDCHMSNQLLGLFVANGISKAIRISNSVSSDNIKLWKLDQWDWRLMIYIHMFLLYMLLGLETMSEHSLATQFVTACSVAV